MKVLLNGVQLHSKRLLESKLVSNIASDLELDVINIPLQYSPEKVIAFDTDATCHDYTTLSPGELIDLYDYFLLDDVTKLIEDILIHSHKKITDPMEKITIRKKAAVLGLKPGNRCLRQKDYEELLSRGMNTLELLPYC